MKFRYSQRIREITLTALCLTGALSLQACAKTTALGTVSEADRDTTGDFDGRWLVVGKRTASTQRSGKWRLNCQKHEGRRFGPLTVSKGSVTMRMGEASGTGFINSSGKFKVSVPLDIEARESGRSDASINKGSITYIVRGSLADQTGRFVFGVEQFGNAGCSTSAIFQKL